MFSRENSSDALALGQSELDTSISGGMFGWSWQGTTHGSHGLFMVARLDIRVTLSQPRIYE